METDKLLHLLVGTIIGMVVVLCSGSFLAGLAAALAAGILKEIYDTFGNGTVDFWDIFATTVGGLLGSGFVIFCILL